ncbi:hypothetical protein G7K_1484-t1 [Saitoella complicata NRRL Y-17804]|uniref:Uncharacterized protein n=1 Tax=Saitoella complicata (strain BCRC 22490 / CBS 7301 / JCM 7358 / NBRC 10748 / NRRL Y-17804) TaxID=698492 RepID=A0A0E9NBQ8_SAICN|nr:hypothetical protein G7K_1484-t1 [Saitoella complicata NRRL Y-17804]
MWTSATRVLGRWRERWRSDRGCLRKCTAPPPSVSRAIRRGVAPQGIYSGCSVSSFHGPLPAFSTNRYEINLRN